MAALATADAEGDCANLDRRRPPGRAIVEQGPPRQGLGSRSGPKLEAVSGLGTPVAVEPRRAAIARRRSEPSWKFTFGASAAASR